MILVLSGSPLGKRKHRKATLEKIYDAAIYPLMTWTRILVIFSAEMLSTDWKYSFTALSPLPQCPSYQSFQTIEALKAMDRWVTVAPQRRHTHSAPRWGRMTCFTTDQIVSAKVSYCASDDPQYHCETLSISYYRLFYSSYQCWKKCVHEWMYWDFHYCQLLILYSILLLKFYILLP